MATEPFNLKIWKCHDKSGRVETAERTLQGTAHEGGLKFCGPYTYANKSGFWLYSPVDIDICWRGDKKFEVIFHEEYDNSDASLLRSLLTPLDKTDPEVWCPRNQGRNKFSWGSVEPNVIQIWTGSIFETPPGWSLHGRSPINFPTLPCHVMEGILETDWLQQDIWANIVFDRQNEWVQFRKSGFPLAQLVPVRRESYAEKWSCNEEVINRDSPEARRVFEYWTQFNDKKFASGGKQALLPDMSRTKDSTTYYREKQRVGGVCPYNKPKRTVVYVLNDRKNYVEMGLNSLKMLREHNKNIPVKVIFIGKECPKEFHDDAEVVFRDSCDEYFPMNKCHIGDLDEDLVLYLDVDTFVNGDVSRLFESYSHDYVASESKWIYQRGWQEDFLPNKFKPQNSGIQLFRNGFHKVMFSRLRNTVENLGGVLGDWVRSYSDGWTREEVGASLVAAESGVRVGYFESRDVYNIQRASDVTRSRDPVVFHSYTAQWSKVKDWTRKCRKVIWKSGIGHDKRNTGGKNENQIQAVESGSQTIFGTSNRA